MKRLYLLTMSVLSLMLVGCGGEDRTVYEIDTSALEAAFASASGAVKTEIDAAAAAFREEDIIGGSEHLISAIKAGNLSEAEANAIADAVTMVQNWMTNDGSNQRDEYFAALNGVIAALPN